VAATTSEHLTDPDGGPAATRKGSRRAAQILSATLDAIAEAGCQDLTLDGVAQRVGIAKGNLQYYFPTRSELLRAAFAEQIERHKAAWLDVADRPARDAAERLRHLIAFELATNRDRKFIALVLERWSLAGRDEALQALGNDWREWVTERYAELIAELRPDLNMRACRQLAMMAYALMVGSAPYFGESYGGARTTGGLDKRIEEAIHAMIETAAWRA
jgi:AcrR family transcriptional regulator